MVLCTVDAYHLNDVSKPYKGEKSFSLILSISSEIPDDDTNLFATNR
jgi:hypothetical protein